MNALVVDASALHPPDPVPVRSWMGVRATLLAVGILALLAGLWGAMERLGWAMPMARPSPPCMGR